MRAPDVAVGISEIQWMFKLIEANENDALAEKLEAVGNVSISTLCKGPVPKMWQSIVSYAQTTPLRFAISWRNITALKLILNSKCLILDLDKRLAVEKILRHLWGDTEIEILKMLYQQGSCIDNYTHYQKVLLKIEPEVFAKFVEVVCEYGSNKTKGQVLAALHGRGRDTTDQSKIRSDIRLVSIKHIVQSRFDPFDYFVNYTRSIGNLDSNTNWQRALANIPFVIQIWPLLIQLMPKQSFVDTQWFLRQAIKRFPITNKENSAMFRKLPLALKELGYDLPLMLETIRAPKGFLDYTGFTAVANSSGVLPLQCLSRNVIRESMECNIYLGMPGLNLPPKLKSFVLLTHIFELPWETCPISDDTAF